MNKTQEKVWRKLKKKYGIFRNDDAVEDAISLTITECEKEKLTILNDIEKEIKKLQEDECKFCVTQNDCALGNPEEGTLIPRSCVRMHLEFIFERMVKVYKRLRGGS